MSQTALHAESGNIPEMVRDRVVALTDRYRQDVYGRLANSVISAVAVVHMPRVPYASTMISCLV